MSETGSSETSDSERAARTGPDTSEEEVPGYARLTQEVEALRSALAALHVPEKLRTVQEVDTVEDLYDRDAVCAAAPDADQFTGLLALLHRVVTTMRAGHAIEAQAAEDEEAERHVLNLDRSAALTADFHVLTHTAAAWIEERNDPAYVRNQLAANLSRASEEARWLYDMLTGLVNFHRERFAASGMEGRCDEHIPGPIFAARTAAGAAYSMLLIAYLEVARPDAIDNDDAQLLGEVLDKLRRMSTVLVSYGVRRGMLQVLRDEQGRKSYRVVEDIVAAAAAGTDTGPPD